MNELKHYLDMQTKIKADPALNKTINEYNHLQELLNNLLADQSYDASYAIQLSNDMDYLADVIQNNPLYQEYTEAKSQLENKMSERASTYKSKCTCGRRGCSGCNLGI